MSTSSKLIPCYSPEFDALPCKNTPDTSFLSILHVRQIPLLILAAVGTVPSLICSELASDYLPREAFSTSDSLYTFVRTD
jgi:hypothetical protein